MRPTCWLFTLLAGLGIAWSSPLTAADVIIGYNSQWPPYSEGPGEQVDGLLPRIVDRILKRGLGLDIVHQGYPWKRVQSYVESGRIDAFVTYPSAQRLVFAVSTDTPVYTVTNKAFLRRGSPFAATLRRDPDVAKVAGLRVCMMIGDNWSTQFYARLGLTPDKALDALNCLRLVAQDRSDVFIHTVEATTKLMHEDGLAPALEILPHAYAEVPMTFLLSKRSGIPASLVEQVEDKLSEMMRTGEYTRTIDDIMDVVTRRQGAALTE